MKEIPLTQGKFALVDDEGYEYLMQWKWSINGAKTSKILYADRGEYSKKKEGGDGSVKRIKMHRVLMKCSSNEIIDHIDGNGLNNQRYNLRKATKSQNAMNRSVQKNTGSKLKGVYEYKNNPRIKKFYSRIAIKGKDKFLGYFLTPEEAHEAYKKAALELHGEFAKW